MEVIKLALYRSYKISLGHVIYMYNLFIIMSKQTEPFELFLKSTFKTFQYESRGHGPQTY